MVIIAFSVAALLVSGFTAIGFELLADIWMSEPAVFVSVTPAPCVKPAQLFFLRLGGHFRFCLGVRT